MIQFIKREKIYFLMLLFTLALNLLAGPKAKEASVEEKTTVSSMTFEDAGITEEKVIGFLSSNTAKAVFFRYVVFLGFVMLMLAVAWNMIFLVGMRKIDFKNIASDTKDTAWGILDLIRASIVIVFIGYVLAILEGFILKRFNIQMNINMNMIFSTFFVDISVLLVVLYFVVKKYSRRLGDIGLKLSGFLKNVFYGLRTYVFILPWLLLILVLSVWILNMLGCKPPAQPVFETFMGEDRGGILLSLTIFVAVLGPIVEEIFFRGFMYGAMRKYLGVLGSAFLSAGIFSILHTNIAGFLPIMALGVLLAYLYEKTGTLIASITVHVAHNSIIVGFVFFVKQMMG